MLSDIFVLIKDILFHSKKYDNNNNKNNVVLLGRSDESGVYADRFSA